jgi:hypothetical protein
MWAFYYVDFFRYMRPVPSGGSPTLSVCNVAYHRSHLEAVHDLWKNGFLETEIHDALRERFASRSRFAPMPRLPYAAMCASVTRCTSATPSAASLDRRE